MSVSAVTALLISFVDSAEVRDRLIVLGPHHTGTSIVAKALDGFGFHLGDAKDLLLRQDNPLKYWERRDVVDLNNARISSAGLNRTGVPSFVGYGFEPTQGLPLDPSSIIATLDGSGKSWATKDPRLSLTASEWLPRLTKDHRRPAPVCILTVRHPIGFASTMMRYSSSLGLAHWGSIWMRYMTEALRACTSANVSIALVSHSDLVHRPLNALVALQTTLGALGVRLPSLVPASVIAGQLLDLGLGSAPAEPEWLPSELAALPERALSLYVAMHASLFSSAPLPRPQMYPWMTLPPAARKAREAYATLLTTSDEVYLAGAITLGTSIRAFDTLRELLALVTPAVPMSWHDELRAAGFEVVSVDEVEEFWWGQGHERCRSYDPDQDARWGHESTKLRLWELEQYDALLYIDADGLLLGPADSVFELHGFAAERGLGGPWFNAGVMLIRPSQQTFAGLTARGASTPPTIFNNIVDCTEQGLLNAYFDGSDASRAVQLFDVVHPHDPGGAAVKAVVHWITLQCPKPWDHEPSRLLASVLPAECSRPLYGYWWRLYNRTGADVLGQSPGLRRTAPRKLQNEYYLETCSKNCPLHWLADGMCDRNCDNEDCKFDQGDCWRHHRPSPPPPPPRSPPAPRPPPMPPLAPRSGCDCSQGLAEVTGLAAGKSNGANFGDYQRAKSVLRVTPDLDATEWRSGPLTCSELGSRIAHLGMSLPAVRCGCFRHDNSHVCYTVGQCDRPSGNPSAKYPGVYWRLCIGAPSPPSPRWHYITPPPPPPPPIPSQRVVVGGGGATAVNTISVPQPPHLTLRITTGSSFADDGNLDVAVDQGDGYVPVVGFNGTESPLWWSRGSTVLLANYTSLVGVRVRCPTTNGWAGAVEYSSDGGLSFAPLVCTSCVGGSRTDTIVVESKGNGLNARHDPPCQTGYAPPCLQHLSTACLYGSVCNLVLTQSSCPDACSKRVGNGHCHAECYTAGCEWDGGDCEDLPNLPPKCAERCPPKLLNNRECDEECNVEACMFDGNDCDHGHTECYKDPHGKDYRGSINTTDDGTECKVWDAKSGAEYVNQTQSGLGGHNHCRNPTTLQKSNGKTYGSKPVDGDRPWCWRKRDDFNNAGENWGYCDVQKPSKVCGDQSISGKIDHALSELSNEATAAPLIAAILSIASVLLLGLLVFVCRMLKVWHARARDSKAVGVVTSLNPARPFALCSGTSKCTRRCSSNCKPLKNLAP